MEDPLLSMGTNAVEVVFPRAVFVDLEWCMDIEKASAYHTSKCLRDAKLF